MNGVEDASESIITQAKKQGLPIPEYLQNRKELDNSLQVFWQAFFELDTERLRGLGAQPLRWSAITAYADRYGLDEYFCDVMRGLDTEFLKMAVRGDNTS